jgi:hypothetical protein
MEKKKNLNWPVLKEKKSKSPHFYDKFQLAAKNIEGFCFFFVFCFFYSHIYYVAKSG